MIIEDSDFRLVPLKDTDGLFDLELLKIINKGKDNERKEFKNVAYGVTLEKALKYIANFRIFSGDKDINLGTYLNQYHKIIDNIRELCEQKKSRSFVKE